MEKWKDIKNYEGIYQVSNMGQIRKHPRHRFKHGCIRPCGYILKPIPVMKNGKKAKYMNIWLYKGNKERPKKFKIHRLVALNFIPNPFNKPEINHKNGKKDDNNVENLEWVTGQENYLHAIKLGLCKTTPSA